MGSEQDMSNWTDLLHSSTKLVEQAAPSAQFPPLQRNLDQLEALSKKLKAKTIRTEAPSQSIAATRLLAREGINAEQLARDLKSFELKTTFEDVFPAEATSVEEYLQQVVLLFSYDLSNRSMILLILLSFFFISSTLSSVFVGIDNIFHRYSVDFSNVLLHILLNLVMGCTKELKHEHIIILFATCCLTEVLVY
eukprot:XP_024449155.1 nuclear pore complex protein NUP93A-like [Populus trichocarpa]